jgi:hypothetical protein
LAVLIRHVAHLALVLLILSSCIPGAALAETAAPSIQRLSPTGTDAREPEVAVDSNGNALVVWTAFDGSSWRIQARRRAASGNLGPIQVLSPAGGDAFGPVVDMNANGTALIAWYRFDGSYYRVQARYRAASGDLGPVRTLSASGGTAWLGQVAMDADGGAIVAWYRFQGGHPRIQLRHLTPSSVGPLKTLTPSGDDAERPDVAMNRSGEAVLVWTRTDGSRWFVEARRWDPSNGLGRQRRLASSAGGVGDAAVDINGDGDAVLAWRRFDGSWNRVQARSLRSSGRLSPIRTLSRSGGGADLPDVAIDRSGGALIAWERAKLAGTHRIQVRYLTRGGSLRSIQTLSPEGHVSFSPRVVMNRRGVARITWYGTDVLPRRVQMRRRSASGELGPTIMVSAPTEDAHDPHIGMVSDGAAIVVWNTQESAGSESVWHVRAAVVGP